MFWLTYVIIKIQNRRKRKFIAILQCLRHAEAFQWRAKNIGEDRSGPCRHISCFVPARNFISLAPMLIIAKILFFFLFVQTNLRIRCQSPRLTVGMPDIFLWAVICASISGFCWYLEAEGVALLVFGEVVFFPLRSIQSFFFFFAFISGDWGTWVLGCYFQWGMHEFPWLLGFCSQWQR